jgi:hypothetical protein
VDPDEALAVRYGRTSASRRRAVVWAVVVGAAVLAVSAAWVIWVGVFGPSASLDTRDTAFEIAADESVDVRFDVTVAPGTAVSCALQALNERFAIVGWKIVHLPPGETRTRSFEENIRTTERPATGLIYRCWLT